MLGGCCYGKSEGDYQKSNRAAFKTGRYFMQGSDAVQILDHVYIQREYSKCQSVLSVLGACVKSGDVIEVICDGEDEEIALKTLVDAIEGGLGE